MTNLPPPRDPAPAALTRGASIGRYVVLGLVGRGGMGEVYAAYDPELDRKVAVKLLRVKPGNGVSLNEGRQRTLREAQAIARLSHPNVVVVFDVGTFEDKVFIAMEFVDGNTVAYWLEAQPRTWQEILKVFVAAGRGLTAAHDKGLVHRDFKPDNVMIGRDGQIRVMDFGLARQVDEKAGASDGVPRKIPVQIETPEPTREVDLRTSDTIVIHASGDAFDTAAMQTSNVDLFDARLTRTGAMMGTPVYMAPEQFFGSPTDARTDQFSFCVSLYEALYSQRPFEGNNLSALTGNVVRGSVREPPAGSKVPLWVRKILLRGLRPVIGDRYPTMGELLDALGKSPYARRRQWAVAASGVLLAVAFGVGVRQGLADHRAVCEGGGEKLADIWELPGAGSPAGPGEPPRQAAIHAAFLKTGKSYAVDVFNTASKALTAYAQSWAHMYRETCEATQIRHEQSADVLDLRMSCLQERLGGLRALTNVFSDATGEVVENAVGATNALASLDRCADVPLLRAVIRPPEDQVTRAKVTDLRHRLGDLKARFDAGRWKEVLKDAPALVAEARAVGYQPVIAECLALLGLTYSKASDVAAAERAMVEAFWVADSSRHDEVRAEVATNLVFVVGQEGHFEEAQRWAQAAESVLQRLGGHVLLHAWLLNNVGCTYNVHGDQQAAARTLKESLVLKEKELGPDHPDVGISEANLGISLQGMGKNQEALTHIDRSIVLLRRGLGSGHPELAAQISNRGEVLNALGRYQEARQSFEQAQLIWEREFGPVNSNLGYSLTGIGLSYLDEGKPTNAILPLERARSIRAAQETAPALRADTSFALARALWEARGAHGRSRILAEEARTDYSNATARNELALVQDWLHRHP